MAGNKNENNKQESPALKWLRNAILGATMADQPAMMTASGWRLNEKGDYVLDLQDNPDVKTLRDNLASEAAGVMIGEYTVPALLKLSSLGLRGFGKNLLSSTAEPLSKYALAAILEAKKLPKLNPKTISSLSEVPRASLNIPTSGNTTRVRRSSNGNTRLSPEALKTIQYIKNNVESLPEFKDPMYYDAFMKHMDELGIETDMLDISPKTLALILTDLYNLLSNTATGIVKNKVFGRADTKPFTNFNWQNHLGENTGNSGFWGSGNYFSTGMSLGLRPFIISDIKELAYDNALTNKTATKWMLDNPLKRMVVSTPEGMSNKYGFINNGNDFGIEVVTLKNTGIKSLFPDFTTGNGLTFVRNWKNPNIFRGLPPIIGFNMINNDRNNKEHN